MRYNLEGANCLKDNYDYLLLDNIYNNNNNNNNNNNILEHFSSCHAIGNYSKRPGMDDWCNLNCNHTPPNCPTDMCSCGDSPGPTQGHTMRPTQGHTMRPTQGHTMRPTQGHTMRPTQGHTMRPTQGHTMRPTQGHTMRPTQGHTMRPTNKPTTPQPPPKPTTDIQSKFFKVLDSCNDSVMDKALTGKFQMKTPPIYKWKDFVSAIKIMVTKGIDGKTFYIGKDPIYGLVNIAGFLGQCMQETIQYNVCDENNWSGGKGANFARGSTNKDNTDGTSYPLSAACGQLGQSYENYTCKEECPQDKNMVQQAADKG